jgi:arylsulfatase A-like enzyme
MVEALTNRGLLDQTLIVISAKHGQSPIDSGRYLGIANSPNDPITTSPANILASLLPLSESPANPNGIGPTEDDVSLIWLQKQSDTETAVGLLEKQSPASNNIAGIGEIFSGPAITQIFNAPGLPPNDPRTPDILVTPNIGVAYSGSTKKLAEHGGFSHDDTNVMMLLSNPRFSAKTVTAAVETAQIAPTILTALGLDPNELEAVQQEHTQVLPGVADELAQVPSTSLPSPALPPCRKTRGRAGGGLLWRSARRICVRRFDKSSYFVKIVK